MRFRFAQAEIPLRSVYLVPERPLGHRAKVFEFEFLSRCVRGMPCGDGCVRSCRVVPCQKRRAALGPDLRPREEKRGGKRAGSALGRPACADYLTARPRPARLRGPPCLDDLASTESRSATESRRFEPTRSLPRPSATEIIVSYAGLEVNNNSRRNTRDCS